MPRRGVTVVSLCVLGWLLPGEASAQGRAVQSFPARTDVVTVDVVVLDGAGRPVRGLRPSDFTVLEDGRQEEVVAFEARDLGASPPAALAAGRPGPEEASEPAPGRTLAFVVDDLGDERCIAGVDAVRRWIREKADPSDEVSLFTTSGRVGPVEEQIATGRGGLLRALDAVRCRPALATMGSGGLTEWQAYQLTTGSTGGPSITGPNANPSNIAASVVAKMIVDAWRARARAMVSSIEDFSRQHATERGRKPVFVFTEGFIRDDDLKQPEQAIEVANRTNTALYFIDPRGLVAGMIDDAHEAAHGVDLAGAAEMAAETGGALVRSNDVAGSLVRAVDESDAYYLLGYVPSRPPDGKWRKLQVRVARPGVQIRARRGYLAALEPEVPPGDAVVPGGSATTLPAQAAAGSLPGPQGPIAETDAKAPAIPHAGAPASPPALPQFAAQAEAIRVDVVVLDKAGRPVRDLSKADFTLLEDGRPQTIVGFESHALAAEPAADTQGTRVPVASNEHVAPSAGRTIAFLIDDAGIEPLRMAEVTKALSRWLADGADPRDQVTLTTSSRDAWWAASVQDGRDDLEAVLRRIEGKKQGSNAREFMTEWEAYEIDTRGGPGAPAAGPTGPPTGSGGCISNGPVLDVQDRVVDRWFRTGACVCEPYNVPASIATCRSLVRAGARDLYAAATRRAADLLGGIERLSRGFAAAHGRKSIVVLSEGLLRDTDSAAFDRAVDASRRGNTSVSFVDVRGLMAQPFGSAEQAVPARPDEAAVVGAEMRLGETGGGEYIADATGGSMMRDTNDIAAAVKRVADESSSYYLLGYQTDRPQDGRWRKLRVEVARPGVTVRARRGYFATAGPPRLTAARGSDEATRKAKTELPKRPLDPRLSVGGQQDDLPLRMAPLVFETDAAGNVRVLVVAEVDTSGLTFGGSGKERTARLDVTVLGVSRDQPVLVPLDSSVELSLAEAAPGGWWIVSRELRLPPGPAQVRLLVRDTASGRAGVVAERIEVPSAAAPYLSTPILTDRLTRDSRGRPQIVPVAHRQFRAEGDLYCAYEVYLAPGREELPRVPHVRSSYVLADDNGHILSSPATPIAIALGGHLVRTYVIPMKGLAPGHYTLAIHAADEASGVDLSAREAFVLDPPAQAAGTPSPTLRRP